MNNPDNYIEGVYDSNNPANQKETEGEILDTNSLEACLDFYKVMGDSEPLENAIQENNLKISNAIYELTEIIKLMRIKEQDITANLLCRVREKLK